MGPPYLSEMCQPISSLAGRHHLRSAVRGQLAVSCYRLMTPGRRALIYPDLSAWNSLLTYLNDHTLNLDYFKRFFKSFLFQMYWQRTQCTRDFFKMIVRYINVYLLLLLFISSGRFGFNTAFTILPIATAFFIVWSVCLSPVIWLLHLCPLVRPFDRFSFQLTHFKTHCAT